jgi:hypothetical protein
MSNKPLKQEETFLTKLGLLVKKNSVKENKPDQLKLKSTFPTVESFDETKEKPELEAKLSLPNLKSDKENRPKTKEKVKIKKESEVKYDERLDKRNIVSKNIT